MSFPKLHSQTNWLNTLLKNVIDGVNCANCVKPHRIRMYVWWQQSQFAWWILVFWTKCCWYWRNLDWRWCWMKRSQNLKVTAVNHFWSVSLSLRAHVHMHVTLGYCVSKETWQNQLTTLLHIRLHSKRRHLNV